MPDNLDFDFDYDSTDVLDTSASSPEQLYNVSPAAIQPQTTDAGPEAPPSAAYNAADYFNDGSSGSANRSQSSDGDQATVAPYLAQSSLADAQPFEYHPDDLSGNVDVLAGGEGTPGNNQAQNKQCRAVVTALKLNKDQAQQLHLEISKQRMGYHEIMECAKDMFGDAGD
ncbi:hypothetical protein AWB76_03292 [Caballeronia temeraria]|uniref:Uncharacterized protein n=1 Tax=Caballeronia temeraria TaxID=1777137 RepID=A0A158B080_9BURK|nr:hypothetical protein [Caballeronia temeraria]SAK62677.1 hypothetical protein AWB76_03292 [Caballeronia temeraria]